MSRVMVRALFAICFWVSGMAAMAQDFGGLAMLDVARSKIEDLRFGGARIELGLSQGVPYRVFTLTGPNRLVVDFREVDWVDADPQALDQAKRISAVRFGAFRPGWSRLVVEMAQPMRVDRAGLAVDGETGTAALTIDLRKSDQISFDASAGVPHDPRWDLPEATAVLPPRARNADDRDLVVMLDPGHGGIDPGAQNGLIKEAGLMLAMARELRETLRRAGGFDVRMTRDSDVFVSLQARVAAAHAAGADLFISLHADALEEGRARGAAIYTLSKEASDAASAALAERHDRNDILAGLDLSQTDDKVASVLLSLARLDNTPRSEALASHMIEGIQNAVGRVHKRPLRRADFSVLKAADVPSVLVEVGFLSTEDDLRNLQDPVWRAGMAAGLRDGILQWVREDAALSPLRRQ